MTKKKENNVEGNNDNIKRKRGRGKKYNEKYQPYLLFIYLDGKQIKIFIRKRKKRKRLELKVPQILALRVIIKTWAIKELF
jgi:hypothetical protein